MAKMDCVHQKILILNVGTLVVVVVVVEMNIIKVAPWNDHAQCT